MPPDDVVLVTGFPSLLARTVCAEIVRTDPRARVHALVRPKFEKETNAFIESLSSDERTRVGVLEGDAASIDMGLSGLEFKSLSRDLTRIHHCAQVTHLGVEPKAAEAVNVGGTREAIELATNCAQLKCLVHHSTAHVSGDRTGLVREEDLVAGQGFRSIVEETKARSERLMRAAMDRVPIAVVRPSTIVGDSRTGEVDRFDGPYLLILLVVTSPPDLALPLPNAGDAALNLVPIDWVGRASVALGRDDRAPGRTFHLVDPKPYSTRRVFELVARAVGSRSPRGSIPANLAKALLRTPGLERITKSPRAFLETLTTPVTYESRVTSELLASLGVPATPPLETYIERLIEYVKEHVRRRRETKEAETPSDVDDPLV